jgi:hypothetical protein
MDERFVPMRMRMRFAPVPVEVVRVLAPNSAAAPGA